MARVAELLFFLLGVFFFAATFQKPKKEIRLPEGNPFRDNKYTDYLYTRTMTGMARCFLFFIAVLFFIMSLAIEAALDIH
jgi:hypothetical protein